MKKQLLISTLLLLSLSFTGLGYAIVGYADSDSKEGNAGIKLTEIPDEEGIRDPENPGNIVDPGASPSTEGRLRIDFVPQLNFGQYAMTDKDMSYPVNAQLFKDGTSARGNFVQVSDYRGGQQGWTLQIRQESQFRNEHAKNPELNGAVISFDKSWVNSTRDSSEAPIVSKEIIRLSNIGETYNLADAKQGAGFGTWSISFGASSDNKNGAPATLSPRLLKDKPVLDSAFGNQQVYENSAITLSVPGTVKRDPVPYSTVLTWIIAELP